VAEIPETISCDSHVFANCSAISLHSGMIIYQAVFQFILNEKGKEADSHLPHLKSQDGKASAAHVDGFGPRSPG
jgi:hypothetical protein